MIRQILAPGLLRRLVTRTMGWSAVALLAFAVPAFFVSNQTIVTRFEEEARNLAANADRGVADRVTFAFNAAATIAGLPDIGLLVSAKAKSGLFATYLLPVGSRLRLDVLGPAFDLPAALGDAPRFDQVLTNLLASAVKFTAQGSVTVSARAFAGEIVVSVSDTGIGIAPEAQGYVFDEFRQEDASTTRQYGGTGLGLAIAKKLVELQGGRIWLESAPGVGSTFSFTLPSAPAVAAPQPEQATSPA